jgi:4-hydroxythreonine-4-phosphate dehydrogenase
MSDVLPVVGVTMGDPAGIGPEIIVKAYDEAHEEANIVVLGDVDPIEAAVEVTGVELGVNAVEAVGDAAFEEGVLDVLDSDNVDEVDFGSITAEYGAASIEYVERGIELAMDGTIDAMANAPINKEAMKKAGSEYAGHTNLLADRTGSEHVAMMLAAEDFVVSHVTTHIPLADACDTINPESVAQTVRTTEQGLESLGIDDPKIAVNGLNPHAGENGTLGTEDREYIEPGVEAVQEEGIDAVGPVPADSVYNQTKAGNYDGVVAMYHDQGHIPAFLNCYVEGGGVGGTSITAGLPIVRTTTLHGTGHDIAGENVAVPHSMIDTIETAARGGRA